MTTHTRPVLLVDVVDGIATVTLNRPEARNALNADLATAFPAAILELDMRDDVSVIVVTGADPAFCAGFDLREVFSRPGGSDEIGLPPAFRAAIPDHQTPVIGAINGAAVTGGFEIALACDLLIASDRARFADTHAKVGVMPGWGLTILLPEAIGARRAKQMSLTGEFINAETALSWGLVNEVVEHVDLLARTYEIAHAIAALPRPAVRRVRTLYDEVADLARVDAWRHENLVAREWIAARRRAGTRAEDGTRLHHGTQQ